MKKVVVITGVTRGLGKAIYTYLKSLDQYEVIGTSRSPQTDQNIYVLDVTKSDSIKEFLRRIQDHYSQVDVLINNVGVNLIGSWEGTSEAELYHQLQVNFLGTVSMMKAIMPIFTKQGYGQFINIGSVGGLVSLPYNSGYAASKAALEAYCESVYYDLINQPISVTMVESIGLRIENEVPNLQYVENEALAYKDSHKVFEMMKNHVQPNVTKLAVAKKIAKIISMDRPKLKHYVGRMSWMIVKMKWLLPFQLYSRIVLKQFK